MKEQKKENGLLKENEQMNRQPAVLSDEMLEQVTGGDMDRVCLRDSFCGKENRCAGCPFV